MDVKTFRHRRVSRLSFFAFSALTYVPALLVSDVFLVDVLQYSGFDDGAIGIISSSAYFVNLIQLLVIFCGNRIRKPKTVILFGYGNLVAMIGLVYVLALLPLNTPLKQFLVVACLIFGRLTNNFAAPVLDTYKFSFVSYQERGVFTSTNSVISLAVSIIFTLTIGYMRDYYREIGNIAQGLIITAVIIFIFNALTVVSVLLMDFSKPGAVSSAVSGVKDILRHTLGSKSFLSLLLFNILWHAAVCTTTGFWGVYKVNELGYSVGTIQVINMVCNIVMMFLLRPIGRFADKHSYLKCAKLALITAFLAFMLSVFTTPTTAWLAAVYTVIWGCASIPLASCYQNMLLDYVKPGYYMYATAISTCISGLCGFGLSFIAAELLKQIQSSGNTFFGVTVYAQQVLSAISAVIVVVLVLFAHFILGRLPKQQLADTTEE